ncbi:MAG TPA: methylenetetrahydrofolate--tRNA-(uracil(54)-C(5))-methyltransferase (FADH(2)-oxidizing) TrmFO [Candidatus Scatovivens faecipullorum]|nr:methylenetetrahydrofolate--tRNA-(uracil(54)-C(5))-methyltransferase (FADH(2)-oxidizing) TrmFO [Candidatus Scatovivens faecipullorum]
MMKEIIVIGGGLAGSEAALQIAKRKIRVKLYEMKPIKFSEAHSNKDLAEIVCSNSFKSNLLTNACGLLKEELRRLGSELISVADSVQVPAGQALAVDREKFAKLVTARIEENEYIEVVREEVKEIPKDSVVIIATGPLTSESLSKKISDLTGNDKLFFYDAAAPIVEKDSIDMNIGFFGDRYVQEREKDEDYDVWLERIKDIKGSYINLPMNKEEYEKFYNELINSEVVTLHEFEKREIFEGCMPIEIMAKRGIDTLRYGPLKPVGFTDPKAGKRPYAVVQLRQDNQEGNLYNIVGFQTNLKYGEQKRVFSLIPGLEKANFVKYGVMHRNTYINSTLVLDNTYNLKSDRRIFFAGQITGVEGYVESISSGFVAGINAVKMYNIFNNIKKETNVKYNIDKKVYINYKEKIDNLYEKEKITFPKETVIGALSEYISTKNDKFQPMNANFGILPQLEEKIKDKKIRYSKLAERSMNILSNELIDKK